MHIKAAERLSSETVESTQANNKTNGATPKLDEISEKVKSDKETEVKEKMTEKRRGKPSIDEPSPKLPRNDEHDIPIFTAEFLEHNKSIDAELRSLRKSNADFEHTNSILEQQLEKIRNGISMLENETSALKENNQLLQTCITKLRKKLATALSGFSIPGESEPCNLQNIDKYMTVLQQMAANSHGPASLNEAKDILRKLDLKIHL
ncbi:High mobility group protein 20A [Pseudolycoriella hygida]|uniref:High mobility group protein 20A n=1 Tax=Pseudolycoriella hygida TaxID=35572 RepID=A0A9Q0S1J6_9DIPT|nr:High mobility group protein 20A [Pseudolycoriella hygida]